ncbi:MAG: ABC transporter permease, partial [Campylobacterota bacterium]|nr:ABC transporter permease [Campylobacterota bacterium]
MKKLNLYFLEYALNSLLRSRAKNISIALIFTLLIFLLSSMLFIASSIKYELSTTVDNLPDITIQQIKAGRVVEIEEAKVDEILQIAGVSDVMARVWGYYYFENIGANFSIVGIDSFENQYKSTLAKIATQFDSDELENSMIVGKGVKEILAKSYYQEYFNFIMPNGKLKKMSIAGVFEGATQLESNDMIVLSKGNAREIFGMDKEYATDIVLS